MVMGFPLNSENNTLISRECKRMRGVVITFRQLTHYVWVRHAKSLWCSIACCKTQSSPKKCIGLCIPLFGIRKEWEERKSKIYIHVHTNIKTICTKYIYMWSHPCLEPVLLRLPYRAKSVKSFQDHHQSFFPASVQRRRKLHGHFRV